MSSEFTSPVFGRSLFLHIPRTGGTFVEAILREIGFEPRLYSPPGVSRHGKAEHYDLSRYGFVFTVVRNPLELYRSTYCFLLAHNWQVWEPGTYHPWRQLEPYAGLPYGKWVRTICEKQPGYFSRIYANRVAPLDQSGKLCSVLRTEHLADGLSAMLSMIGADTPKVLKSLLDTPPQNCSAHPRLFENLHEEERARAQIYESESDAMAKYYPMAPEFFTRYAGENPW